MALAEPLERARSETGPGTKHRPVPREATLIVNAHSRRGQKLFDQAKAALEEEGVILRRAEAVTNPERLADTVRAAIDSGVPMVIVGGGDGSLSGTVDEFVGKDCVFAVLPLGTANSFARTLGLPLDLPGAVEAIAHGQLRRVDLASIDGDYFVNCASIGLSPMIGESVPHKLKRYLGRVGYLLWAARCFVGLQPFRLIIKDAEGKEQRMWSTEVRILNGRFHGGVELTENTDVDSGDIIIQAVTGRSLARLVADWYAKFFRLRSRDVHTEDFRGTDFILDTRPHHSISIDGEVLARTPVRVKVAAAAVDVVVPI